MPCRVLICDDNDDDVSLLLHAFSSAGLMIEPMRCHDGEEAIRFLSGPPNLDLIVMDEHLPRRTGREVLQTLKSRNEFPLCPVVVFTSQLGFEPWGEEVLLVLEKPFSLEGYLSVGQKLATLCS